MADNLLFKLLNLHKYNTNIDTGIDGSVNETNSKSTK